MVGGLSKNEDESPCRRCFCDHEGHLLEPSKIKGLISIVIPLYNEEKAVGELLSQLQQVLSTVDFLFQLILVDDASTDATLLNLLSHRKLIDFEIISLQENSGHASAIWSGMRHASGEAIITLDGDLQHPPQLIPVFVEEFRDSNYDVIYAIRNDLSSERWTKRASSHLFFLTTRYIFGLHLIPYANDFRLISFDFFNDLTSKSQGVEVMRALLATHEHSYQRVSFDLRSRQIGETKFTLNKMLKLYAQTLSYASLRRTVFVSLLGLAITSALVVSGFAYSEASLPLFLLGGPTIGFFCLGLVALFLKLKNR